MRLCHVTSSVKKPRTHLVKKKELIKRVLVALDGSEQADKALDFALDLAEKYSANLVLLSVVPRVIIPLVHPTTEIPAIPPVPVVTYSRELKARHEKILSEALKKAKEIKPDLKVSTKLVEGRPADKMVETAREGNFDIVVMGSRGLGGIKEFLLGSVSDRVADKATCPVLIVK